MAWRAWGLPRLRRARSRRPHKPRNRRDGDSSSMRRSICGRPTRWTGHGRPIPRQQLPEPFGYDKLMPMMNEAGVDRVCIVPPSWEGDRVDYAIEAAGKFPGRFGIMGRIALGNQQSATLLPTWKEQTGMLGIRVSFTYPQQYEKLSDGSLDWFWPACEKAGIPLMFNAPGRMPAYARIAERHPRR